MISIKFDRKRARSLFASMLTGLRSLAAAAWRFVRTHPRTDATFAIIVATLIATIWWFASSAAAAAIAEERVFWAENRALTLEQRTEIKNSMVKTGRVPHLLPWWEMDVDRCSAVAWKFVNLLSGVELTHGRNGAAWMLRGQNESKLATIWDGTSRFKDGELGEQFDATVEEFRRVLENERIVHNGGLYMAGFRWTNTSVAGLIERDRPKGGDINSHVVVITGGMIFHMIHTDPSLDPIIADHQEGFFYWKTMQPVWLAEVWKGNEPFRFSRTTRTRRLEQRVYPWKSLRWVLAIPDWFKGVNAIERAILYWMRNGYDQYPHLH